MRRAINSETYARRIWLLSREIAIALALTLAAVGAIVAAIGSARQPLGEAPVASVEQPQAPAAVEKR